LDLFVENRILNIRSKINDAVEELKKTKMPEKHGAMNFEDTLYWVQGVDNSSDTGMKYKTFDNLNSKTKMIMAEDCSPTSMTYIGLPWMKDIHKQIKDGKMKSAKTIKQANEPLKGEDLTNFNNCIKTTKTPQLQETEQVLIDGQMKTLKMPRNAMTTLTQSKLACHQCNQDFFEETFMSKIFCQTCKQIRTEDDLTQCAIA
jgi:hypothetical protein